VRLKVDIIVVAGGTIPIQAAKNATKTIPIVMMGGGIDPVEAGLIESLARPGGNVTGLTNLTRKLGGKRLKLLKEAVSASVLEVKEVLPVAARALGLTIRSWEVRDADGFEKVFATLSKQRPDGLYVAGGDSLMFANGKRIAGFAIESRLPSVYGRREAVDAGGLMSYGADREDMNRRVAAIVDKLLKGRKPADIPVEQPIKFELMFNLKTAKQIGVTIPPNVLPDKRPVTMEELLVSSLAQTDALAKLLIEKGRITREEFMQKISEERATYRKLFNPTQQ